MERYPMRHERGSLRNSSWPLGGAFMMGAIIGSALGGAVLASGTLNVLFTPWWQQVLFYPGFVAGWSLYTCCGQWLESSSGAWYIVAGFLVTAAEYGGIAVGVASLHNLRRRT